MASTSPPIRFLRQDSTTSSIADMNDVDGGGVTAARRTEGKKKISYRVGIDFVAFFSSFLQPPPPFFFLPSRPQQTVFQIRISYFLTGWKEMRVMLLLFCLFLFLFPSCHRWDAILVGGCVSVIEEKSFTIPRKEKKKSASRKFALRKNERKKTRRRRHPQFF